MAEKITVKMEDGTEKTFGAKQKLLKDISIDAESGAITVIMYFKNGRIIQYTCSDPTMLLQFAGHGASQKLGDETSGIVDLDDCVLAVEELISRLDKGEWSKARTSNGMAGTSVLLAALVRMTGKPVDGIKAYLSTKSREEKTALKKNPEIKKFVDEIEAEKLAAKLEKNPNAVIDTDSMLNEISALG